MENKEFCVTCLREMKVAKVGQMVLQVDARGEPYKLASGDVLECPACGHQIVTRFGNLVSRQGDTDFEDRVEDWRGHGLLEVN